MQHWNITEINAPDGSRSPQVLHSQDGQARVVAIHLQAGQELGDHQVKEAAFVLVVAGEARVEAGGQTSRAVAGDLFRFEPDERRSVSSEGGARILLTLAPWPGDGHYRGERVGVSASSPDAA